MNIHSCARRVLIGAVMAFGASSVSFSAPVLAQAAGGDGTVAVVSVDTSGYPDASVVVAAPATVPGVSLDASAFRVIEDGRDIPVRVQALTVDQLEVALVVDTSGSMNGAALASARTAALELLSQLPLSVPVSVVGFGATAEVVAPRSADRLAQIAAVRNLQAAGETALYDAVGLAIAQFPPAPGTRRMIVALSDGGDTASVAALEPTADALAVAEATLFVVELMTPDSDQAALRRLASASGGSVIPAADARALGAAFDSVAKQLVRQYALDFRSQGSGEVQVVIDSGGARATADLDLAGTGSPEPTPTPEPVKAVGTSSTGSSPSAEPGLLAGSWALVAGTALVTAALLAILVPALAFRTPRARGLGRGRSSPLAEAAARAEELTGRALRPGVANILSEKLEAAGLDLRPAEMVIVIAGAALAALAAGWVAASAIVGLALALAVVVGARVVVDRLAARRRGRFEDQLAETLQLLSGSLRAGHGLAQAVDTVAREADPPTSDEFRRLTIETRLGRDLTVSMAAAARRMGSRDFGWVVEAVDIHREVGGDLADIFDSLGGTIRDRTRIRRQVSALSAEGRMSAWVLVILPLALGLFMSITNSAYIRPLYTTGKGLLMLAGGLGLLAVGGLWLRRIVKPIF